MGFRVLHFPYEALIAAFARAGVDARFEEDTPDAECAKKVQAWDALGQAGRNRIARAPLKGQGPEVTDFMRSLELAITRQADRVVVLPLHGSPYAWESVDAAVAFIAGYNETDAALRPVAKYEIQIQYNNGDSVKGEFVDKESAVSFLQSYLPPLHPAGSEPMA